MLAISGNTSNISHPFAHLLIFCSWVLCTSVFTINSIGDLFVLLFSYILLLNCNMVKRTFLQEDPPASDATRRRIDIPEASTNSTDSAENDADDLFSSLWNSAMAEARRY